MIRRVVLSMALMALLVTSCSISKTARGQRAVIDGAWMLDNIVYENETRALSAVLFNDVRDICFEGSEWFFRNNNSTGTYTITQGSLCQGGERFFRWSVVEDEQNSAGQLQFKFIDQKRNDISGGYGYRLRIVTLTENAMALKSSVTVEGQPVTVLYQFIKK